MSDIFEKFARLRQIYPTDIQQIEQEEERVKASLKMQEYASLPVTQELLKLCREQIVHARKRLATDKSLLKDPTLQQELWGIIDARKWFVDMVSKDFDSELVAIERELDAELARV